MARITLDSCPISTDSITAENFEKTRLVVVGKAIYPIIGDDTWDGFTSNIKRCPMTQKKGEYTVLAICELPPDLKDYLLAWLVTGHNVEIIAPTEPTKLAQLLVSLPSTGKSENPESEPLSPLNGKFSTQLYRKNFDYPYHMNLMQHENARHLSKIAHCFYSYHAINDIRLLIEEKVKSGAFNSFGNNYTIDIEGTQYRCSRRAKQIYTMIINSKTCPPYIHRPPIPGMTTIGGDEIQQTQTRLDLLPEITICANNTNGTSLFTSIFGAKPANQLMNEINNELMNEINMEIEKKTKLINNTFQETSFDIIKRGWLRYHYNKEPDSIIKTPSPR